MSRPSDWSPLRGADPTPGDPDGRAGDLDVLLWLSTFDTGLALRAMDDVDALARSVHPVED